MRRDRLHRLHRRFVPLALSLLLAAWPATAAAEVGPWLDKLAALYESGPFSFGYTLDMSMEQRGQKMTMTGKGDVLYGSGKDGKKMRMQMEMTMTVPGMPEPMVLTARSVGDGENVWTEIEHPMMGRQVIKIDNDDAEKAAGQAGMMGGIGTTNTDPLAQIAKLRRMFDLREDGTADGAVVLRGPLTQEARDQYGEVAAMFGENGELVMHLDRENGFPRRVEMGPAGAPMLIMKMTGLEFLDAAELPADSFVYTPPEGANVVEPLAGGKLPGAPATGGGR